MKYLLIISFLCCNFLFAQNYSQSNNKLFVGGGIEGTKGVAGEIYYENLFNQKGMPLRVGYLFNKSELSSSINDESIGVSRHLAYISVGYPMSELLRIKDMGDTWQIYPSIGFTAGIDALEKNTLSNGIKISSKDGFVYGGFGGLNAEIYLFNSLFAVDLGYKFMYLLSDLDNIQNFATGGIKFNF